MARENTTCLIFSPGAPTNFAGQGERGQYSVAEKRAITRVDVSTFVERKVEALAQHRTQYPIRPNLFPLPMLQELLGTEYFMQVYPPTAAETDLLPSCQ